MLQSIFDIKNPFWQFMNKLFDVVVLNFMWILFSLPVVTAGVSTTAVYSVSFKMLRGDSCSVVKDFWTAWKANVKQATVLGLIVYGLSALLALDLLYFFMLQGFITGALRYVICIVLTLLLIVALAFGIYAFALQALFENTVKGTLQNAFLLALRYPIRSLGALIVNIGLASATVLSLYYFPLASMVLLLFGVGLWIFIDTLILRSVMSKYLPPEEEDGPPEVFE